MKDRDLRISEETAQKVMELAAKLYVQQSQTVSAPELIEAGKLVEIPAQFTEEALKQIYAEQPAKAKNSDRLPLVTLVSVMILLSGLAFFLGYQKGQHDQYSVRSSQANPYSTTTLTVQPNQLQQITDKNLMIAIQSVIGSRVYARIESDGYEHIRIDSGEVGDVYKYKGAKIYRIRIIQINDIYTEPKNAVTFRIDQLSQ